MDGCWIEPFLFSLNENCWKRVTAIPPKYTFYSNDVSMPFVNGAVHWIGYQEINNGRFTNVILGFDFSAEGFFELGLPESLIGGRPMDLSTMKYGESSIAMLRRDPANEWIDWDLAELWVIKEYGVVESWTKVLTSTVHIQRKLFPNALGFRKNGEVLMQVVSGKMAKNDLNHQHIEPPVVEGVEVTTTLIYLEGCYVESLVLLGRCPDCEPVRTDRRKIDMVKNIPQRHHCAP